MAERTTVRVPGPGAGEVPVRPVDRVTLGCLVAFLVVTGLVVWGVQAIREAGDAMISGPSPRYGAGELRDRPVLQDLLPVYVGALDSVAAKVQTAQLPGASRVGAAVGPDGADARSLWRDFGSQFVREGSRRPEQVVDRMRVRKWRVNATVDVLLTSDPAVLAALEDSLLDVVAPYGFRRPRAGVRSGGDVLLDAHDRWGAEVFVAINDDGSVRIDLSTGLHLSNGSEEIPEGVLRAPLADGPTPV